MSEAARCPTVEVLVDDTPRPEVQLDSYERWYCLDVVEHGGVEFLLALRNILQRARMVSALPRTVLTLREKFSRYSVEIERISNALVYGTIHRRDRLEIKDYHGTSKVLRIEIIKVNKR
ncbi:MAG: hypothetical protein NVS3B9_3960 [Candidatus Doudnabacteria bacterium]